MLLSQGTIAAVNAAWLAVCGFAESEVVGQTAALLQGVATAGPELERLEAACRSATDDPHSPVLLAGNWRELDARC